MSAVFNPPDETTLIFLLAEISETRSHTSAQTARNLKATSL